MRARCFFPVVFLLCLIFAPQASAQSSALREVHADGLKFLNEAQVVTLTGLTPGNEVARGDLQNAADILVRSGLFAHVTYNFNTRPEGVTVTFHLQENPRLAVSYDNFPWYSDSELNDAIHLSLPFYDGTLPEAGTVVDLAGNALQSFLDSRGVAGTSIEHTVLPSPLADTSLQQFRLAGLSPKIASVEFGDPNLQGNLTVRQHLPEIIGKPFSRLTIDLFLSEAIQPIYLESANLRAKIGPAEVRLTGNPNKKLPEDIPVYVPCVPGAVYTWKGVVWSGNKVLSEITLTRDIGLQNGAQANGMTIQAGWFRIGEDYGHVGYLETKVIPVALYDDQAHTVSYQVKIEEGPQYHYSSMTVNGLSVPAEKLLRAAWPVQPGEVFDKTLFEQLLIRLQTNRAAVFHDLPLHYDTAGHFLQTDPGKGTVDILWDFK
jgi:outer membrane protein assembly factor BamA